MSDDVMVWVGQTQDWQSSLYGSISSLSDLAEMCYRLFRLLCLPEDLDNVNDLLDWVFREGNIGKLSSRLMHSISIGDVVVVYCNNEYRVYVCEPVGWRLLTKVNAGIMG